MIWYLLRQILQDEFIQKEILDFLSLEKDGKANLGTFNYILCNSIKYELNNIH